MKTVTKFVTDDGEEFDNADDARAHEDAATFKVLAGLTEVEIASALSRANTTLADAFEKIGARIAKTRLAAGEKRRERKAKGETVTEPAPESAASGADRTEGLPI